MLDLTAYNDSAWLYVRELSSHTAEYETCVTTGNSSSSSMRSSNVPRLQHTCLHGCCQLNLLSQITVYGQPVDFAPLVTKQTFAAAACRCFHCQRLLLHTGRWRQATRAAKWCCRCHEQQHTTAAADSSSRK
jgi:hypothetical protein